MSDNSDSIHRWHKHDVGWPPPFKDFWIVVRLRNGVESPPAPDFCVNWEENGNMTVEEWRFATEGEMDER